MGGAKDCPDVPEPIASSASEVHECLSINAARAAIALSRATLEAAAKDVGHTGGTLQAKINAMADAGPIRQGMREAAHEVRLHGNEIARRQQETVRGDDGAPSS